MRPLSSLLIAAVPIVSLHFSAPAWAQEGPLGGVDAQRCNGEIQASAQAQIASCSALIDSHKFNGKNLGIIYSNRGIIWLEQSNYYKAVVDFDEATALDPSDGTSFYHRGLAKGKIGDVAGSKADIAKAEELNPEFRTTRSAPQTAAPAKPAAGERKSTSLQSEKTEKHGKKEASQKHAKAERRDKSERKITEHRQRPEVSDAPRAAQSPSATFAPGIPLLGLTLGFGGGGGRRW
jgi:tetratricopeptide (TPR) repeat protein